MDLKIGDRVNWTPLLGAGRLRGKLVEYDTCTGLWKIVSLLGLEYFVATNRLTLYFEPGDRVRILRGQYKDAEGVVVQSVADPDMVLVEIKFMDVLIKSTLERLIP